ncbi:MAG: D-aminoacyl-tRNA deacylase [bacterium]|nr:D-aminoacyl-tRNA deacylase [bacterium]
MKILVQRVSEASVSVNKEKVSEISEGLLVFVGFSRDEKDKATERAAEKLLNLRIFEDENGKMNKSIKDTKKEILLVPQFTLCAETKKGNRPSFDFAAESDRAAALFEELFSVLSKTVSVKQGRFKELMDVYLVNHGPATFMLEIE